MINELTQQPINDEVLAGIAELAVNQRNKEAKVLELEEQLEKLKDELRNIQEIQLPEAMMGVGLSSFKLTDGTSIQITKFYSASIPKDRTTEAFAWLRTNDFSEIIKRQIVAKFGKGEDDRATQVAIELAKLKVPFEDKETVHPQTLKAFVREQIEGGHTLPLDLLGVYVGNKAKVTAGTK